MLATAWAELCQRTDEAVAGRVKKEPADKGRVLSGSKGKKQCTFSIDGSIKPGHGECADFAVGFWMTKITEGGGGEEDNAMP